MNTHQAVSFENSPCERCGSKKIVSKMRKEVLQLYSGTSVLEVSHIVCSNKVCQKLFNVNRAVEVARKNEIKEKKEKQDQIRKDTMAKNRVEAQKVKMAKSVKDAKDKKALLKRS